MVGDPADLILEMARTRGGLKALARLLVRVLPNLLEGPDAHENFRLWEDHGFHLTPVHFYQPIPDTRTLVEDLWTRDRQMTGVDMNEAVQLDFLRSVFPRYRNEYGTLLLEPSSCPHDFYLHNLAFSGTDALVLYCMVHHFQPDLILEIGSGFSSRLSAQAALRNGQTRLVCVEPYPDTVLVNGFPGLTQLIQKPVQELEEEQFRQLRAGDILFIDSSHVVKCGGDVNFLFFEVIPKLNPGVVVHLHDIFLPQEFPRSWMVDMHWFWTEQYLLQAFLTFNSEFEVLFANAYMGTRHSETMREVFPRSNWWGGSSFWMRRKARAGE